MHCTFITENIALVWMTTEWETGISKETTVVNYSADKIITFKPNFIQVIGCSVATSTEESWVSDHSTLIEDNYTHCWMMII